jgi:hypothetical protein
MAGDTWAEFGKRAVPAEIVFGEKDEIYKGEFDEDGLGGFFGGSVVSVFGCYL